MDVQQTLKLTLDGLSTDFNGLAEFVGLARVEAPPGAAAIVNTEASTPRTCAYTRHAAVI